ncbi:MAG: hypothetical protein KME27_04870 [Lyngbya sp. HA4199-MV5]|nr:hypothetical protein [Lyngbya sp. HA4199-MV5]
MTRGLNGTLPRLVFCLPGSKTADKTPLEQGSWSIKALARLTPTPSNLPQHYPDG